MQDFGYLNQYQKEAVFDEHSACLVNAIVGSGKTTVLTAKIAYLLEQKNISPEEMIVLTFTNKAAGEIRERLQTQQEKMLAGTFHGVALKLLQEKLPVEELHYTKEFQICLPEEELEMARSLIMEHDLDVKYKNRLQKRLERLQKGCKDRYEDDLGQLSDFLKQEKVLQNKMSFEDLLVNASILLKRHPQYPEWVIVDEVQDCDQTQLDFLDALIGTDTSLFAVGDPNQVIYGWRGSRFQIFYYLKEKYHAAEISLPVNYRSNETILRAASRFVQNGNRLEGIKDAGEKITVEAYYDAFQEADVLAEKIYQLHGKGMDYSEIGILYRLQSQAELLEKVLKRERIPVKVSVKENFLEIPVVRWLHQLLRYLVNGNDRAALFRVVTDKSFGDGLSEKKLCRKLEQEKISEIPLLVQVSELFQKREFLSGISEEWIELLTETIRLRARIGVTSGTYEAELNHAMRFLHAIPLNKEQGKGTLETLQEFMNEIALNGMSPSQEENETESAVRLMTIHASKGLEFQAVFLIGMNDGILPLRSLSQEEREEEQRLFFVGITRAMEHLELSYYTGSGAQGVIPGPSVYLKMIRSDLLAAPIQEMKDLKQSAEHLQKIKRMVLEERDKKKEEEPVRQRIHHAKYGYGHICREDETMIVIEFDDYGEKEMLKAFTTFTLISE